MRLPLVCLTMLGIGVAIAACGREGLDDGEPPRPSPSIELPSDAFDAVRFEPFGDGRDGSLVVTSNVSINSCARVEETNGARVVLSPPLSLQRGDRLLLWETQNASFATSGDTTGGVSFAGNGVDLGRWEIARVSTSGDGWLDLAGLERHYGSGALARAQACHLPQFASVTVTSGGSLFAPAWNGTFGGVVAFFSSGVVVVESGGEIEASAKGFRGGAGRDTADVTQDVHEENTLPPRGGFKGEGVDRDSVALYGRGNIANGGGGGNGLNGGGGGGGNGGAGGRGGWQFNSAGTDHQTAGRPGSAVAESVLERMTMGGGGGSGHQDGTAPFASGGNGGGVVLVFAAELELRGRIVADGEDVVLPSNADGGSGGGAGGTIALFLGRSTAPFQSGSGLFARGGKGGDTAISPVATARVGPGGGGGGGRIVVVLGSDGSLETDVRGGFVGECNDDPFNATAGSPGTVEQRSDIVLAVTGAVP